MAENQKDRGKLTSIFLLKISALLFLLAAIMANELVSSLFYPEQGLQKLTITKIRNTQLTFLIISILIFLFTVFCRNRKCLQVTINKIQEILRLSVSINIVLIFTMLITPVIIVEMVLRSHLVFTTVYLPDPELGWRMRPNVEDHWEGVVIKTNSKGLRGPEISYERSANVFRILHLGDSIPFGYKLTNIEDAFSFLTEQKLKEQTGSNLETVNAAVAGYSPWQEKLFLEREAIKYRPDLIILNISLNDLTDKFHMMGRYNPDKTSDFEGIIPTFARRMARKSGILYYATVLSNRGKFVLNTEAASMERKGYAERLMNDQLDHRVREIWEMTFNNLVGIFEFCRTENVLVVMVIFPFDYQLTGQIESRQPQTGIIRLANQHNVPVLDLLPQLREMTEENKLEIRDVYMDVSHPTQLGHKMVADILVDFLVTNGIVD